MNRVYVVMYDGYISSEAYDSDEKAISFIKRNGSLEWVTGWKAKDRYGLFYTVHEVIVR